MAKSINTSKNTEEALIESETRYRTILDTVLDGIITINNRGIITNYNRAAENIFGYSADSVIGSNIKMLMPEPYAHEHDGYLENYEKTGIAKIIGIGREVVGKRIDGTTFPMDLAVTKMQLGKNIYYTGMVRDITERKRIEKMKNEFISTVSHELRTPLTSIRGSLGLLTSGAMGKFNDQVNEMLRIASNNTERLLLLINDILDLQKIESGVLAFKFENIELKPFLQTVILDIEAYADQYNVKFNIMNDIKGAQVFADRERLTQVLNNLLSNAAKFSPTGEIIEVNIARHHDNRIRISVTDHGPGIAEDFQSIIFERFTQSDATDTRTKGGTGLGLAIAKLIIEKHGGIIDFISREGIGSTFYIEIPEMVSSKLKKKTKEPAQLQYERQHPCVLIVEDDPDVAALIQRMLTESGFNSDIAYDTEQARQFLSGNNNQYKLITMDILLPKEDGISFLNRIRNDPDLKHIPVVVVSVKADETKRNISGGAVGVVDWIQKPIDQKRLSDIVSSVISKGKNKLPRILHVEDEEDVHTVVQSMLQGQCEMLWTTTVEASREVLENEHIDLVLLDIGLPDGSGLDLLDLIERKIHPPRVVIFSAQNVSEEYADKVSSVLLKSSTSNGDLLKILLDNMQCNSDRK